jgi:hypothetical protein
MNTPLIGNLLLRTVAPAGLLIACGASMPPPTQRMADAQSAQRAALELGAQKQASAQLHVKLADEQIARAKKLMAEGENEQANGLLYRAKADSELAVALAHDQKATSDLQAAMNQANTNRAVKTNEGSPQ